MESISVFGRLAMDAVERKDPKGRPFLFFTLAAENTVRGVRKETLYKCAYTTGLIQPWMRKGAKVMVAGRFIADSSETEDEETFELKIYANIFHFLDKEPKRVPSGLGNESDALPEGFSDPFSSLDRK